MPDTTIHQTEENAVLLLAAAEELGYPASVVTSHSHAFQAPEDVIERAGLTSGSYVREEPTEEPTEAEATEAEATEAEADQSETVEEATVEEAPAKTSRRSSTKRGS